MKPLILLILFGIAPLSASAQNATPISFYGVQIGAPLQVKECKRQRSPGTGWSYDSIQPKPGPCYERNAIRELGPDAPLGDELIVVRWPFQMDGPPISKYGNFGVRLVGGMPNRIHMSTNGADAQEEAFTGLVGKFGKPSSSKVEPLQNRMGAKFDSIEASWRLGDVSILFVGINGSLDNGFILIETPAGRAAQQQFIDKLQSPKPKM